MKLKSKAKILFFIADMIPSLEESEAAAKLDANVHFRNASRVPSTGNLEICDGVAGVVPASYANAFESAENAIQRRAEALKQAMEKHGETPAPKTNSKAKPVMASGKPTIETPSGTLPVWNAQKVN